MSGIELKITNPHKHLSGTTAPGQNMSDSEKTKLAGAAKEFESLLTSLMLKSMNETAGGMFGSEGFGGDYFDSIFESEIASQISRGSKGFGIAESIYRKVTGEELDPTMIAERFGVMGKLPEVKINNPENNLPFLTPSSKSVNRVDSYEKYIDEASDKYGIDKNIIKSVILTESAGNAKAVSHAKAKGLMQLMDGTAKDMGVKNSFDPRDNIMGGTKYLSTLLEKYDGDLKLSLAAYNAGPGNVEKYEGIPPFDETKTYVTRVLGYLNYLEG
jgi:soluble lytic murein transglycosylase-like protein